MSATWLPHAQLEATGRGTALLTQCYWEYFLLIFDLQVTRNLKNGCFPAALHVIPLTLLTGTLMQITFHQALGKEYFLVRNA